ncbi:MAG TPA: SpoIID/LytB domain-containing protein [Kamptonema sp.]|nr:SpoIID/LytB domain-containing protein [Kamptonema sp.]
MLTQPPQTPVIKWFTLSLNLITALSLLGTTSQPSSAQTPKETPKDRDIKIGVVQRFGTKPTDKLTLKATPGSSLTLRYQTPKGIETTNTASVKLEVAMKPLPAPVVDERVILSAHRSFESAEDSANQWRSKGIEVEIAQPERWQVWAKRDVYKTPLLRRLLLESLQAQGNKTAFIDTKILKQVPQAFWVLNGFRYNRNELKVTAGNNAIEVAEGTNPTPQDFRRYGGTLQLQTNAYGTYTLVNEVPVETYLRGVVPHEIGAFSPYASIEAQTILARTYALRNVRRFAIDNYELCADTNCQVYKGLTEVYPETDRAIATTRGLVIVYKNELVDALYSAASGGVTATFGDVWHGPERPYLRAVIDSPGNVWDLSKQSLADEQNFRRFMSLKKGFNEEGSDAFRWREETTLPAMTAFLKQYFQKKQSPLANFKAIQQVSVTARSPAGRVLKMVVQTDVGKIEIDKDEIRNAFEPPISTLFYLDPVYNPDKTLKGYAFVGGGFGHGVGMSQTGSYNLAKLGWSSDRILSFYFPGTTLQPLTPSLTFWREPELKTP